MRRTSSSSSVPPSSMLVAPKFEPFTPKIEPHSPKIGSLGFAASQGSPFQRSVSQPSVSLTMASGSGSGAVAGTRGVGTGRVAPEREGSPHHSLAAIQDTRMSSLQNPILGSIVNKPTMLARDIALRNGTESKKVSTSMSKHSFGDMDCMMALMKAIEVILQMLRCVKASANHHVRDKDPDNYRKLIKAACKLKGSDLGVPDKARGKGGKRAIGGAL